MPTRETNTNTDDPYRNFRFAVEVDQTLVGGFSEVTLPEASNEPIEYRVGDESPTVRKLPNLTTYGDLTLKRGLVDDRYLNDWWQMVVEGNEDPRKTVTVIVQDLALKEGTNGPKYQFVNAWPRQYDAPDLNATANEVAIESMQIAHEGMERLKE